MKYKNLNLAFLIEIIVGFGCILSIALLGYKGLMSLVLIGLRPFLLEKEKILDEKSYWHLNYRITFHSLIVTSIFIMTVYFISYLNQQVYMIKDRFTLLQLIPFFLLTHGVTGIVINGTNKRK